MPQPVHTVVASAQPVRSPPPVRTVSTPQRVASAKGNGKDSRNAKGNGKDSGFGTSSVSRDGKTSGTGCGKGSGKGVGANAAGAPSPRRSEGFGSEPVCLAYLEGACHDTDCVWGRHPRSVDFREREIPSEQSVFVKVSRAKLRLLQTKWADAGGYGELVGGWQIQNKRLDRLFRGTAHNMALELRKTSDTIDGWHGTMEQNVFSIARQGFDTRRRSGQVYGAGEYFAKNPCVSIDYCRGGSFMFLCKLLLGEEDEDHTWVSDMKYYVMKHRDGKVLALPLYVVQFRPASTPLSVRLSVARLPRPDAEGTLAKFQRGGQRPCPARPDAGIDAEKTSHIWLGWLSPCLASCTDDEIFDDVVAFLKMPVVEVIPERNGARVGAYVKLQTALSAEAFRSLQKREYKGYSISVDDTQPDNPRCRRKICPRLSGPSKYCRGWNVRGHNAWHWGCAFDHPLDQRPTHGASYTLERVFADTAKYDEILSNFLDGSFHNGRQQIRWIYRVVNPVLERLYEQRRNFLSQKHGFADEKELWHGTSCSAIPELLTHGLQPPADSTANASCPRSGGRGLCTTLCGKDCQHCTEAHGWGGCHMFGHGIYLADMAAKSHRYVKADKGLHSLLVCRVVLGNSYLIEGNLLTQDSMHNFFWCSDPTEQLENPVEDWSLARGHDSYYVRGLSGNQKHGLGVANSEYVVFQPFQVLPIYKVDYVLK